MNGFLLDTNFLRNSPVKNRRPQVERWLDEANDEDLYFSVISLGEILKASQFFQLASAATDYRNGWTVRCDRGLKAASCR